MNAYKLIDKYYPEEGELKALLIRHSEDVRRRALAIVDANPHLHADRTFVAEAALLHDIGIFTTNAPDIHCFGTDPYIMHGRNGGALLRAEGLERHARVCERHTGAGLPGFLPETIEEIIVCYADKFYSKSHPERTKTIPQAIRSLKKFGDDGVKRFLWWAHMLENDTTCRDETWDV